MIFFVFVLQFQLLEKKFKKVDLNSFFLNPRKNNKFLVLKINHKNLSCFFFPYMGMVPTGRKKTVTMAEVKIRMKKEREKERETNKQKLVPHQQMNSSTETVKASTWHFMREMFSKYNENTRQMFLQ